MQIIFNGLCSGTETKKAKTSGNDYQITLFVEMPAMKSFSLFGDFNLPQSMEVRQYVFEVGLDNNGKLQFPKLVSVNPASAVAPVAPVAPVVPPSVKK